MNIKYYESKMNLNWKPILKSITDVRAHPFHRVCYSTLMRLHRVEITHTCTV